MQRRKNRTRCVLLYCKKRERKFSRGVTSYVNTSSTVVYVPTVSTGSNESVTLC